MVKLVPSCFRHREEPEVNPETFAGNIAHATMMFHAVEGKPMETVSRIGEEVRSKLLADYARGEGMIWQLQRNRQTHR